MLKPKPEAAAAEYEKIPFEVTPFLIYLTRESVNAPSPESGAFALKLDDNAAPSIVQP
jgi:hypothetical protein